MNFDPTDPIVLGCLGAILIGVFALIWAIGRLRKSGQPPADLETPPLEASAATDDLGLPPLEQNAPELEMPAPPPTLQFDIPAPSAEPPPPAPRVFSAPTAPLAPAPAPEAAPVPASMAAPMPAPVAASPNRDVADRLEVMNQRLAEMQTVLSKQPTPGTPGQGFSTETVEKLLKIIGNVIVQVDILQRSLNLSKEAPVTPAPSSSSPSVVPLTPKQTP